MKWIKKGLIFCPNGQYEWNTSYASVPTVDIIDDRARIYYASRDTQNRTHISFIEVKANKPEEILYIHEQPIISPGTPGMFDDCGAMPSMLINRGNEKWLYYLGWNVRNTVPYHNAVGLAISKDQGISFEKFSEGPLFDRSPADPYFSGVPYILIENGLWRMWYLSSTRWVEFHGNMEPYYHIKYAESSDGIHWKREGRVAIDFKDKHECGIVRACVLKDKAVYKMWYSHRNLTDYRSKKENSYRIGYAESSDGLVWQRLDDSVGITISEQGWDSEMIEYPYIYDYDGRRYMIYNGNKFGQTGFGYAMLEK